MNNKRAEHYKCIYCLTEKGAVDFNKEHVLQESFGGFQQALTLTSEVCQSCNKCFGEGIDAVLSRDSYEALLRLKYGIKPSEEYFHLPYKRIVITIPDGYDDWSRVKVVYRPPYSRLMPQIGFRLKNTKHFIYFTLREIEKGIEIGDLETDEGKEIKVIAPTKDEYEKLISFLRRINIPLGEERKLNPIQLDNGQLDAKVGFIIDRILLRAIAKIGFNYMAKMCGASFALRDDFNLIRRFIRYGEPLLGEVRETIEPSNIPIFANDDLRCRRLGHILLLEWDVTRRHVLAKISLFNSITWTIMLAKNFSGIFREIKSCHFYDIQNHVVHQRPVIRRELLP